MLERVFFLIQSYEGLVTNIMLVYASIPLCLT